MPVIDFHTHIAPRWVSECRDELSQADPCFGMLYGDPRARLASAADLIDSMDEAGVTASVALNIGWSSHDLCVRTNDYLLESAARWPERIVPFCMVQPTAGEPALRELERCAAAGAKGVGELRPDTQGYSLLDTHIMAPMMHAAAALHMIVLPHVSEPVGHSYPGKGGITPEQPYGLACAFPEATIVCAHWGGGLPFYALMPEVRAALARMYFDTAATQYLYRPEIFDAVVRIVGRDRVLFGSDYPLIRQRRALEYLQASPLSPQDQAALQGANAASLLHREGTIE